MGLEMLQEESAVRLSETEVRSTPCRDGLGMVLQTVFLGSLELSLESWNQHSPGKKGPLLAEEFKQRFRGEEIYQACAISKMVLHCWLSAAAKSVKSLKRWAGPDLAASGTVLRVCGFLLKGWVRSYFVLESILTHSMEEGRLERGMCGGR